MGGISPSRPLRKTHGLRSSRPSSYSEEESSITNPAMAARALLKTSPRRALPSPRVEKSPPQESEFERMSRIAAERRAKWASENPDSPAVSRREMPSPPAPAPPAPVLDPAPATLSTPAPAPAAAAAAAPTLAPAPASAQDPTLALAPGRQPAAKKPPLPRRPEPASEPAPRPRLVTGKMVTASVRQSRIMLNTPPKISTVGAPPTEDFAVTQAKIKQQKAARVAAAARNAELIMAVSDTSRSPAAAVETSAARLPRPRSSTGSHHAPNLHSSVPMPVQMAMHATDSPSTAADRRRSRGQLPKPRVSTPSSTDGVERVSIFSRKRNAASEDAERWQQQDAARQAAKDREREEARALAEREADNYLNKWR